MLVKVLEQNSEWIGTPLENPVIVVQGYTSPPQDSQGARMVRLGQGATNDKDSCLSMKRGITPVDVVEDAISRMVKKEEQGQG